MTYQFDAIDEEIKNSRFAERELIEGPRMGDYILFPTGELERFSHDWGESLQTSPSGSFHLQGSGHLTCGGLNPATPLCNIKPTMATLPGLFWFFHHGRAGAGRAVHCSIPCRVFSTSATYEGFLGKDFQSSEIMALKIRLHEQLQTVSA